MRTALRHADFRVLLAALTFGMAGESVLLLVLAIWANELTGSATAAAVALLFVAVPYLLAPVGGWLVDRVGAKKVLVATYAGTALSVLSLLTVRDPGDLWVIYAVGVVYGISVILVDAALTRLVVLVIPEDLLAGANGASQTVKQGLRLFGPLAGAGLYAALGGTTVALITTGLLAVATTAALALRVDDPGTPSTGGGWRREVGEGATVIFRDPALRSVVIGTAIAILALQMADAAVFALVGSGLHRPPEFVGVLVSTQAVGGIAGGFAAPWVLNRLGEVRGLVAGCAFLAAGIGLLAVPVVAVSFIGMAIMGLGVPLVSVSFMTQVQRRSPRGLVGRVAATASSITSLAQVVSLAVGATLVAWIDYRGVMATMVAGLLVAAAYLWSGRHAGESRPLAGTDREDEGVPAEPRRQQTGVDVEA
ncbi:MFS transporter [Saccharothrix sp. HUAS TT1]|uniref:MFS transporter n=1 Tax=unclassified Saccharothrix TaxID=2593673 RepID=UPI00345C5060